MNEWTQPESQTVEQWTDELILNGWCWYEDDKPQPHLWNRFTDVTSSIGNMLIRASKVGIDKKTALTPLEKRIPIVSGKRFAPELPEFVVKNNCTFINTFKSHELDFEEEHGYWDTDSTLLPSDPKSRKRALRPFLEFCNRLVSNSDDLEWLLCWIAHMLQKPSERPSVHPLFRTEHGIGKNVLVEVVIDKLLCKQTVTTSLKEIRGSHSESAASNLLVFVDESKAKGMNVYLELKSLLTTKELLVNPKHIRPYKQEIFSRFMFADNTEGRAFNIEQEDRRIYVMQYVTHEENKAETQKFVAEFIDWFNVHWELVFAFLDEYDISEWSPHVCPLTEAKRDYLNMCLDPVDAIIQQYLTSGKQCITEDSWNNCVQTNRFEDEFLFHQLSMTDNFKYKLEAAGYHKSRPQGANGKKVSGYFLNGLKGRAAYDKLMAEAGHRVDPRVSTEDAISELASEYTC
ncbi:primase-helicase family protein [Moritella sp. Urea-trap-13]|uniref:primase-helicase family protein n=1 Tax=Moritella sp. Urea-trap-13 TaxID=2058327 RepID=UPI000C343362|nr:primase-helicase family protein [Moritella sp. Urea-trap-13]PKH07696.1 hypothetical protein CXF93_03115 [Moritella sp. Urea-trap-13]